MSRETLHLLLLTDTQNEAESIVSLFRNAGHATRAHHIQSLQDFMEQLQEKSWDMVFAAPEVNDLAYSDLLTQIDRLNIDLPLILLSNELTTEAQLAALKAGAKAIAPTEEPNLLLLLFQQELHNLSARREVRELEVRLRDAEKRCQSLLESSRDAIAYIHDGMHIYGNKNYLELFGYQSSDELEGIPILDMIDSGEHQNFKQFLRSAHNEGGLLATRGINGKGQPFAMQLELSPAVYEEEECTLVHVVISNDSSELEAKLERIRNLDQLTGLYNKPYLNARLEDAVTKAVRKGERGALIYIDLDSFGKTISEIGINQSDTIILAAANAFKGVASQTDILARTGEDIFCLLRMGCEAETALELAEQLRSKLADLLIEVGNRTVTMTASIGVALITDSNSRPLQIAQQAHSASLFAAKHHKGGNHIHLYVAKDNHQPSSDSLEQTLITALKENLFSIVFQPLISLRGVEVEHYEALLRLRLADGSEKSAGEFFVNPDISDEIKCKIDRWVIFHTAKLLGEHLSKGHNSKIFINLCSASLADSTLVKWINSLTRAAKLPKGSLIFQFHENDAIVMLKQAQDFTRALQANGVATSISRFGGAVNPMQALSHLAVEYVKIDGSFTQELSNADTQKQLKSMLGKLHQAEKITIIPSVENASAMATLWQTGAHFLQGYGVQAPQAGMTFNFGDEQEI